jgi:hypothetical protein
VTTWHAETVRVSLDVAQIYEKLRNGIVGYSWQLRDSDKLGDYVLGRRADGMTLRVRLQPGGCEIEVEVPGEAAPDEKTATTIAKDAAAAAKSALLA